MPKLLIMTTLYANMKDDLMKLLLILAAILLAISASPAGATTIDFDGTSAPCNFSSTSPLTNLYAGQGVTFSGNDGPGAMILNQCGSFGFNALSGTDFLAFNGNNGTTGVSERLTFSSTVTSVSIWAATGKSNTTFTMEAFDAGNNLLTSALINGSTIWQELTVSANGIAYVNLFNNTSSSAGAYDNLQFSADGGQIPESASLALILAGLASFSIRRNRKSMI